MISELLLFDCDGTLVDSMPLHLAAWNAGLAGAGAPYTLEEEDFYAWGGIHEAVIVGTLNERHGAEVDPEQVIRAKAAAFESGMSELQPILPVSGLCAVHGRGGPSWESFQEARRSTCSSALS